MKRKELIMAAITVVAVIGIGIGVAVTKQPEAETPVDKPVAMTIDPNRTTELVDAKTDFEVEDVAVQETGEKANAGSGDAENETAYDVTYENQLAIEEGRDADNFIVMYAVKDADVKKEADANAENATTVTKGMEVKVYGVAENGYYNVNVKNTDGFMAESDLADTKESAQAGVSVAQTQTGVTPNLPEVPTQPMEQVQTPVAEQTPVTPQTPTPPATQSAIPPGYTAEEWAILEAEGYTYGEYTGDDPNMNTHISTEEEVRKALAELGIDYDSVEVY